MVKRKKYFGRITLLFFVIALIVEAAIIFELEQYKKGLLDIYGIEQDGYVKITLDQIYRLGPDATEDEITSIIASMDATSSKYWTLSTGDNILFIKSVTETDRYKVFTTGTYYQSDSAKEFVENLQVGNVIHSIIELDDGTYVASGGNFVWNGVTYRICLLTLENAILDKNILLEAENAIIVFATISLAISVTVTMILSRKLDKNQLEIDKLQKQHIFQNKQIEHLNDVIKKYDTYNANSHIFAENVIEKFMNSLEKHNINPLYFALFSFNNEKSMYDFLAKMQVYLDDKVLRFHVQEDKVLLVFAGYSGDSARRILNKINGGGANLMAHTIVNDYNYYQEY